MNSNIKKSKNSKFFLIALWVLLLLNIILPSILKVEQISYSQFQTYLSDGKIKDLTVSSNHFRGEYTDPKTGESKTFSTVRISPKLADKLSKHQVEYKGIIESTLIRDLLSWILPVVFFIAIWLFFIRRVADKGGLGGSFMSIGKSKAKVYIEEKTKVTFKDVAGIDEAKEELQEIINFLKDPKRYSRLGGHLPKGILLVGPPGTGKTLLAKAVAGEAAVPFFSISGSEFVEMFVGVGAARVRDLFDQARKKAPCIIFIDELDALGRARALGVPGSGGHDEKEQTLNQLLAELDGFDPSEGVVLLAATNRPEVLDPALLRAGRFDRQILVDRPDKRGREQILKVHVKKIKLGSDVDIEELAALTPGFTGADLANLVNEAALLATRRDAEHVTLEDCTRAIERIIAGLEKKNRLLNPKERKIVAYHEMGHALVALSQPESDQVVKVSIIPRGVGALGYTISRPLEDRYLMSQDELLDKLAVLLGGRAAESIVFDQVSTGAADDLSRATEIARSMVTRYGMDQTLGLVNYERESAPLLTPISSPGYGYTKQYSEETSSKIDQAIKEIINRAFERAVESLKLKRELLEESAHLLLEKETLDRAQIDNIIKIYEKNPQKLLNA